VFTSREFFDGLDLVTTSTAPPRNGAGTAAGRKERREETKRERRKEWEEKIINSDRAGSTAPFGTTRRARACSVHCRYSNVVNYIIHTFSAEKR